MFFLVTESGRNSFPGRRQRRTAALPTPQLRSLRYLFRVYPSIPTTTAYFYNKNSRLGVFIIDAGVVGIEPTVFALEASGLPLTDTPMCRKNIQILKHFVKLCIHVALTFLRIL